MGCLLLQPGPPESVFHHLDCPLREVNYLVYGLCSFAHSMDHAICQSQGSNTVPQRFSQKGCHRLYKFPRSGTLLILDVQPLTHHSRERSDVCMDCPKAWRM